MATVTSIRKVKGGDFLINETECDQIFIAEEWNEEQRMIAQSCKDFLDTEVFTKLDKLDSMQYPELMPGLLMKTGQLGLLGSALPEEYGGFGMDFNTNMLIAEAFGSGHSFVVAFSAHTGIGTLPILYFGTEEQKLKYLPKMASGEWLAAYCLTEPDSGSDANSGKTKATLSKDGKHYIINGQKMWITNGGFAEVLIVFAKIDQDENLSAFIVEKSFSGITMNEEEKKMGIKGSSTRQIFFNDCQVPVENLLGERGQGFKIALDILNVGRVKLGAACIGGSKKSLTKAIAYSNERKQFGKTIGSFGAIKHKIGQLASEIYAAEAALYRLGQNIEDCYQAYREEGLELAEAKKKAVVEFAIESAIIKVFGSEVLDHTVDETVQIFGGMGYSADGPVERGFRDARINRIFEGTNEINRLVTIDMLLKRAMKGAIDLISPAMEVQKELTSVPDFSTSESDEFFAAEKRVLKNLKKAGLMAAGAAVQKLMNNLKDEQEILMHLADMLIEGYVAESVILRVEKLVKLKGEDMASKQIDMARIFLHGAVDNINRAAKEAIYAFAEGDELRMMLLGLKRFTKIEPCNLKEARRRVADDLLQLNQYSY